MSDDTAVLVLWAFGLVVFLIAVYLVASVPSEMSTSNKLHDDTRLRKDMKSFVS